MMIVGVGNGQTANISVHSASLTSVMDSVQTLLNPVFFFVSEALLVKVLQRSLNSLREIS